MKVLAWYIDPNGMENKKFRQNTHILVVLKKKFIPDQYWRAPTLNTINSVHWHA